MVHSLLRPAARPVLSGERPGTEARYDARPAVAACPVPRSLLVPLLALALAAPAHAAADGQSAPPPADADAGQVLPLPTPEQLEARGARIGTIEIKLGDIFDESKPGENFALFKLANRLHPTTREQVVRRVLLIHPGEPFSARRMAESERLLRTERWFYDVRIRPVRLHADGTVDLEVVTRDVWSLGVGASFHRAGGANTLQAQIQDTNLLGFGKDVAVEWESNIDRTTLLARYRDHYLAGSRVRLEAEYAQASDGSERLFALERRFYSLGTRWAAGVRWDDDIRVDALWELGHIRRQFGHESRYGEAYGGIALGHDERAPQRLLAGFAWSEDTFWRAKRSNRVAPPPARLPPDHRETGPWLEWSWLQDGFVTTHDLDKIQRTEDLNLGGQARVRLGWSSRRLGASREGLLLDASWSDTRRVGERVLLIASAGANGRWHNHGFDNSTAAVDLRCFVDDFRRQRLLVSARADLAHRLDPERQLLLGGEEGLRGYPLRYQQGDRSFLFSVEQRFYSERELLHLFRVGAAAFFDAGKAWFVDTPPNGATSLGLLRNIGVGLRVANSRSARAAMVHLDVAWPLDGPQNVRGVQWLVSTSDTF
jgi:hypothetical protein